MLEIIDSVLGPLFRQNPVRFAFDRRYRQRRLEARGKEARYVFLYQVAFALAWIALVVWSYGMGYLTFVFEHDVSRLSYVISAVFILALAVWAEIRGETDTTAFHRRFSTDVLRQALTLIVLASIAIALDGMKDHAA